MQSLSLIYSQSKCLDGCLKRLKKNGKSTGKKMIKKNIQKKSWKRKRKGTKKRLKTIGQENKVNTKNHETILEQKQKTKKKKEMVQTKEMTKKVIGTCQPSTSRVLITIIKRLISQMDLWIIQWLTMIFLAINLMNFDSLMAI